MPFQGGALRFIIGSDSESNTQRSPALQGWTCRRNILKDGTRRLRPTAFLYSWLACLWNDKGDSLIQGGNYHPDHLGMGCWCRCFVVVFVPCFLSPLQDLKIIFHLGIYKSRATIPRYLSWMFAPDCMDVLWRILRITSIPRPYYTTEGLAVVRVPHENYPPVSGYRILVSMVVITFGIGKAACGYVGLPTAANSFDWIFAVVATSMFVLFPLVFAVKF